VAQRTVRFYEIVNKHKEKLPNELPFDDLRSEIEALPDVKAYVTVARMELLGSTYAPGSGAGARRGVPLIALDRITRDVRMRIERRRNYRPLLLEQDETLAEPTFYSIFEGNVLGVMRNGGRAPGPASFRDYINTLGLCTGEIEIAPLADRNVLRALREVDTLTKLDIAVGPDVTADVFGQSDLIAGAIHYMRQGLGHVGIEVIIRMSAKESNEASEIAREQVERVVRSGAMDYVDKAEISYRRLEDGKAACYDFISQAVATSVDVELEERTGQPTEPSAAEAMAEAYDTLYEDIRSALKSQS